jgi:DNA-binding HxlR family transcriptional regulator
MLRGKQTYTDLLASPERIPTSLLAERLERLERAGLISSSAYQQRPVRYAYVLTDKGKALGEPFEARYLAFLETIADLRPSLHRYCSRMTESAVDGEDVVQDALFQAYAAATVIG